MAAEALLIGFIAGIALLAWMFRSRGTTNHDDPAQDTMQPINWTELGHRPAPSVKITTSVSYVEPEEVTDPSGWIVYRGGPNPANRPPGFVVLRGGHDARVVGISHRLSNGLAFVNEALSGNGKPRLELHREVNEETGRIAVRVMASASSSPALHIGYMTSEMCAALHESFSREMPIAAELRDCGKKPDNSAAFVRFNLLAPKAEERRQYALPEA